MSRRRHARGLTAALLAAALWLPATAQAGLTDTLPQGTFLIDVGYVHATTNKQFDGSRKSQPLLEPVERYEPGGGLQGILRANPEVLMQLVATQVLYGVTDRLTFGLGIPVAHKTTIDTNLSWTPGDFNSTLGRPYSEEDFWLWAASMGQPKPPDRWVGNKSTLGDIIVATRYRGPTTAWMDALNLRWSIFAMGALPTGREANPEALVEIGTTAWWLHNYGDAELHLAADWNVFDAGGIPRFTVGTEVYYAWLRTRTYDTPQGTNNPLLQTYAPYVGDTFQINGGDWTGASIQLSGAPFLGPTLGTWMTRGSVETAERFPPMLTLSAMYTYLYLQPSKYISPAKMWNWEQADIWGPGDKHIFAFTATLSLLRVGAPVQLYARYRTLDLVPGRNSRPANALMIGTRLLAKFW
jgi:hypothetical protein